MSQQLQAASPELARTYQTALMATAGCSAGHNALRRRETARALGLLVRQTALVFLKMSKLHGECILYHDHCIMSISSIKEPGKTYHNHTSFLPKI